jgi:predicted RNA-binding Zn-ribbon protein involved in translation (DUF1610 family)
MFRDEKCKKCERPLFKVVPLPPEGKYWAMCNETEIDLASDATDSFFECPHCGAKNIISEEHSKDGPPQFRIVSWK